MRTERKRGTGEELRLLRRSLDLTQWDVAARAGVSQPTIVRAEAGQPVGADTLTRIAKALTEFQRERR